MKQQTNNLILCIFTIGLSLILGCSEDFGSNGKSIITSTTSTEGLDQTPDESNAENQQSPTTSPPTSTPAIEPQCLNIYESRVCDIIDLVNLEREARGLQALVLNQSCQTLAEDHSDDMATNGFFSHTSPTQGTFFERSQRYQVGSYAGENIAAGTNLSAAGVMTNWMNSSGHRANILNAQFTKIGVGIAESGRTVYYTQCFSN